MKRNALLIGGFVVAALVMIVVGVLWLSGNSLFKKQHEAMIYYKGNVSGLYVGAPVTFRGVAIGQVAVAVSSSPETKLVSRAVAVTIVTVPTPGGP